MPSSRTARIQYLALLQGSRIDDAVAAAREALPDPAIWDALDVELRTRAHDHGRLDELLAGRAGLGLARLEEHQRHAVERVQRYATVEATVADPANNEILRAATAVLCALAVEEDLLLAVDIATGRWWEPTELARLAPQRAFDLDEQVSIVVEAIERRPGVGHIVRSRGLTKFARPDVAARAARRDAERFAETLRDLARVAVDGELLLPRDRVRIRELPPFVLLPRTDDCLADAAAEQSSLFELRDADSDGNPADDCAALVAALRPRPRLKVLR